MKCLEVLDEDEKLSIIEKIELLNFKLAKE